MKSEEKHMIAISLDGIFSSLYGEIYTYLGLAEPEGMPKAQMHAVAPFSCSSKSWFGYVVKSWCRITLTLS